MSRYEASTENETKLIYSEDRTAVRPPLAAHAVLSFAAFLGFGTAMNLPHLSGLVIPAAACLLWAIVTWIPLFYGLYTGIRVDADGIRIGGIRARESRVRQHRWPPRRPFRVAGQSRAVFTCPWDSVRSLYLITDAQDFKHIRSDLKQFLKERKGTQAPLGMLHGPFMKAALVITHNAIDATSDPADFRPSWGQYVNLQPVKSPTWMVPTRNPQALRAALQQIPGAPPVQDTLPRQATFQFRSG